MQPIVNEESIKTIKILKENGYHVTATVVYTLWQAIAASSVGADAVTLSPDMLSSMLKIQSVDATVSKFVKTWTDMYGEKKIYEL